MDKVKYHRFLVTSIARRGRKGTDRARLSFARERHMYIYFSYHC